MTMTPRAKPTRTPTARELVAAKQAQAPAQAPAQPPSTSTAVTAPDNRPYTQRYLDEIAPASIVGRMIKFDGKEGTFVTPDDGEVVAQDAEFIALADQTVIGWVKFNGPGEPPDRIMGLLYGGFVMPPKKDLPDRDQTKWELGLDGKPADPFQHHIYLVLQHTGTGALFTFVTSNNTGRRAAGNLLHHYERMQKTHPDQLPVVRLRPGGFQHHDDRVGWVPTPVFTVVGRAPHDSTAKPDTSIGAFLNDSLPEDLL